MGTLACPTILSPDASLTDLRNSTQQYVRAIESMRQARKGLSEVVIKYVIANGVDLARCTELAISENLGLPRSTTRSVLLDLVEEGVLKCNESGNTKPYVISESGIGIALDWLDLTFTKEEVHELLSAKQTEGLKGLLAGSPLVFEEIEGKKVARYRGLATAQCLGTLTGRFIEYVEVGFEEKLREAFGQDLLKELRLLSPELSSFEVLVTPSPVIGAWATGGLQELEDEVSAKDIKKAVVQSYERSLSSVVRRLRRFASLLEEEGYERLHDRLSSKTPSRDVMFKGSSIPRFRFHDEFLWATTLALREGCEVGEKMGVERAILDEARSLADALDLALERKYKGAREESGNLAVWSRKQSTIENANVTSNKPGNTS